MQPPSGQFDAPPLTGTTLPAVEAHAASPWSQRALLRWLTVLAIALLLGATAAFLWTGRQRALEDASDQALRRVAGLAQDLEQSLALARLSIEQAEARLASLPPGTPVSALVTEAAADRSDLLSALPLPFELHALDPQGRVLDVVAPARHAPASMPALHEFMPKDLSTGRWHVGNAEGPPLARTIPLVWAAAPNPHGVTGYSADLSFSALLARLERDRVPDSGGAALVRIEADGSATVLVRAPFAEQELGQTLRTPWVRALATAPHGVVETLSPLDGIRRQIAFQRLGAEADSMAIAYGVSTDATLAAWNAQLPFVVLTALLLAGGMGYGGWRLDRSLGALAESEKRFRLAAASGHVWDWDLVTGVLRFPSAAWRTMGFDVPRPGETARLFASHLHKEDVGTLRANLVRHLRDREPFSATFRMLDARGRLHWFETQGQASWNTAGRATYMAGTAFEITERQTLEESQRQIQQRLDTVANASPALIWTSGTDQRADWFNRAWLAFTGRTMAQEVGEGWLEGMHPDDHAQCMKTYLKAFEARESFSMEHRLRHHSGEYRWLLEQGRPRYDADNRFIGYIGSCLDLTELRKAEATARERGAMLEQVFDVLQDMLFVVDEQERFVYFQAGHTDRLYAQPEQFLGRTISDVMPPHVVQMQRESMARARDHGLQEMDYSLELPVGLRHFNARLAWLAESGHCMFLVRDVTDQQRAQRERVRLNEFVLLLFSLANRFINLPVHEADNAINDALGDMGRFVDADRAYLFDYDMAAETASNTHEWCGEGVSPEIGNLQNIPIALIPDWFNEHSHGRVMHVPDVQALPEGPLHDFLEPQGIQSLMALPLMDGKRCLGFVGLDSVRHTHNYGEEETTLLRLFAQMLVNIRLRVGAEEQIRELTEGLEHKVAERTAQLESSVRQLKTVNHELESFTYSASHDLRTPLRGIEGFSSLLLEEHAAQLDGQGREYLQRIQRSTLHMSQLVNDLLAYSRLQQLTEQMEPVTLADCVQAVAAPFRDELEARHGELTVRVGEDLKVQADPQGLAIVLRNLMDNALKFTPAKDAPRIRIEARAEGDRVLLSVSDQGIGFDMLYHDRIFGMFQRLHRQEQIPGTGIGLALVHKAVERMGGRIRAESTPGQGATFHIELLRA